MHKLTLCNLKFFNQIMTAVWLAVKPRHIDHISATYSWPGRQVTSSERMLFYGNNNKNKNEIDADTVH